MKRFILFSIIAVYSWTLNAQTVIISGANESYTEVETSPVSENFYFFSEVDGVAQNKQITLDISGISATYEGSPIRVRLKKLAEFGGAVMFTSGDLIVTAGALPTLNIPVNLTFPNYSGVLEIEVIDPALPAPHDVLINFAASGYYIVIEKLKTVPIPGATYDFLIAWCDDFFSTPSDATNFILQTEQALNAVWGREVNTWNLCSDLVSGIPENSINSYYLILINPLTDIPHLPSSRAKFLYRSSTFNSASMDDNFRRIGVSAKNTFTGITQQEFLYEFFAHEFLHGIQASYVNFDPISPADMNKMTWLIEGQAKFIETAFMQDPAYNTTTTNAAYAYSHSGSYAKYTEEFIDNYFYNNYKSLNTPYYYAYAPFWRHIYEQAFPAGSSEATKMAFLREAMKRNNSTVLTDIETNVMDASIATITGGTLQVAKVFR